MEEVGRCEFKRLAYARDSLSLIMYYNLPCYEEDFALVLEKGCLGLFHAFIEMHQDHPLLASASVKGGNKHIIQSLLERGYSTLSSLVYQACLQDKLDLFRDLYSVEIDMCRCVSSAVLGGALSVLRWITERDATYLNIVLQQALVGRNVKVLSWLPRKVVKRAEKRELFFVACGGGVEMLNFLIEKNYLPRHSTDLLQCLAKTGHVQVMRTLVSEKHWPLDEEVFISALEGGSPEMLSCLLELGCPWSDLEDMYSVASCSDENTFWLLANIPPTEDILLELCSTDNEAVIVHLVKNGLLPESFDDNSDITLAALNMGYLEAAQAYLEAGYTFHDDVCLQVDDFSSLGWLIKKGINLSPELYYKLASNVKLSLMKKLDQRQVDFPSDLLEYVLGLISKRASCKRPNVKIIEKLQKMAEWVKSGGV
jgi:hypothetical protein